VLTNTASGVWYPRIELAVVILVRDGVRIRQEGHPAFFGDEDPKNLAGELVHDREAARSEWSIADRRVPTQTQVE